MKQKLQYESDGVVFLRINANIAQADETKPEESVVERASPPEDEKKDDEPSPITEAPDAEPDVVVSEKFTLRNSISLDVRVLTDHRPK